MSSFLAGLLEANIAAAAAVALVLALRGAIRRRWGAHAAYLMWAAVPAAMMATLIPARTVIVQAPSAALEAPAAASAPTVMGTDWLAAAVAALPWLWLAGLAATGAWLLLGQARFLGDVRRGKAGPAVVGLLRPHIVIPSDFGGRFASREQELILAHEHVHLARHDARLNTLVALARCVCWFNPMIHVGAHAMRIDQELSCDAAVVGRRPGARRAYAEALLKTQLAARPLPLGCYWPAGTQHPLTERIAMLTRNSPSRRTRLLASAGVVLLAAGAGVAAWAAQPEQVVVQEALIERDRNAAKLLLSEFEARLPSTAMMPEDLREWRDQRIELLRTQIEQPAPPAPLAPRAPLPPLDRGAAVPAPETPPTAPTPPAPPVPSARGFASLQTPEAPVAAPAPPAPPVPSVSAVPGVAPTPAVPAVAPTPRPPAVPAPLAAPAPAPQQLSQSERDELMRRLEAQRQEMDALLREIDELRARAARQQSGEAAGRDALREQKTAQEARERLMLELVEKQRATNGDLKLNLPKTTIDGPAVRKMLEESKRYKEAAARTPALDGFPIRKPDGTIRNKVVTGQIDKSFPFDSEIARARAAAEKRKMEQAAREKQKPE